jgi:hypothetical protein
MTASFLNYYAPDGYGGVMVCHPYPAEGPDFYYLRTPQPSWHHGEAIITTNDWTDGTFTPHDEDFGADWFYGQESPKTHEQHWNLLASRGTGNVRNLHMFSIAYRGRENMTIWADGRVAGTARTPRVEYEWADLFPGCPTLTTSPERIELRLGETSERVGITATADDPDGDQLSLTWTAVPPITVEGEGGEIVAVITSEGDYTVTCSATDGSHTVTATTQLKVLPYNHAPEVTVDPERAELQLCGEDGVDLYLTALATDQEGDPLSYGWIVSPDATIVAEDDVAIVTFTSTGSYTITCTVSDGVDLVSVDIPVEVLECPELFRRADANADGRFDMADAIYILQYLFASGPSLSCRDAADANDDGALDLADATYILQHLFANGPVIPPPFAECGVDTTVDGLECLSYEHCPQ